MRLKCNSLNYRLGQQILKAEPKIEGIDWTRDINGRWISTPPLTNRTQLRQLYAEYAADNDKITVTTCKMKDSCMLYHNKPDPPQIKTSTKIRNRNPHLQHDLPPSHFDKLILSK